MGERWVRAQQKVRVAQPVRRRAQLARQTFGQDRLAVRAAGAGGAATKTAAADGAGLALSISASVICSTISVTTSSPHNSPRQLAGGQGASEGV